MFLQFQGKRPEIGDATPFVGRYYNAIGLFFH
jgi:hypothetical protein